MARHRRCIRSAIAQGTLRIAITATDVPTTTGVHNNGLEGVRLMGFSAFDALVNWDLSKADTAADIVPGLAESWQQDAGRPQEMDVQAA